MSSRQLQWIGRRKESHTSATAMISGLLSACRMSNMAVKILWYTVLRLSRLPFQYIRGHVELSTSPPAIEMTHEHSS